MFFWVTGGGDGIKSHIFGSATFYVGGGGGRLQDSNYLYGIKFILSIFTLVIFVGMILMQVFCFCAGGEVELLLHSQLLVKALWCLGIPPWGGYTYICLCVYL